MACSTAPPARCATTAHLARPALCPRPPASLPQLFCRPPQMVNLVTAYFDTLLTQGNASIIGDILEPTIRCGVRVGCCCCALLFPLQSRHVL